MSDKDLLARLRAKAAQQESTPPAETESGGESSLLSRLQSKSTQLQEDGNLHTVPPIPSAPQTWTPSPEATVEQPVPMGVSAAPMKAPVVESPEPLPSKSASERKVPLTSAPLVAKMPTPEDAAKKKMEATSVLSTDFSENMHTLAPEYQQAANTHFIDEKNPINQLTNPHGSPEYTGRYVQQRIGALQKDLQQANTVGDFAMRDAITQKITQLKESAPVLIDLQLFNKEYTQKKYTPALAATATGAAEGQYQKSIKEIDDKIADTRKGKYPNGIDAVNAREALEADKEPIERQKVKSLQDIKMQTKYNEVMLGSERSALMGNPQAREDYQKLLNGGTISPEAQYAYHQIGRNIIQNGLANTTNEAAKKEATEHADIEGKKLIEENKPFLVQQARGVVANKKYADNPWYSAVVPAPKITKKEIRKYATEAGIDDPTILTELEGRPNEIPTQATLWQQAAKGSLDFLAPTLYERGVRSLAYINGIPSEKVEQMFYPGWQNDRGLAAKIVGNTPSDQNSFHNVTGALGMIAETAGMLSAFGGVAGKVAEGLETTGLGEKAAERGANFGIMALEGYNNAYQESKQIIGEKPEDESLRQIYSVLSGTVQGALFSAHPPSRLVKNALGEATKTGEQFLDEIKNTGINGAMKPEFAPVYAKYIKEIAKAQGMMIAQSDANLMAQNALKNIFSPKEKQVDVTQGLGDETIRTAISFLLPSIASGIGIASQQTPLNKAVVFEIGTTPQKFKDMVAQQAADGKFTQSEANNLQASIDNIHNAIRNTPTQNDNGDALTPDQVKDYSFNLLQEGIVQDKIEKLQKRAELFKLPVDKAQEAPLKKTLSELQGQRSKILETAGEGRKPIEEKPAENLEVSDEKSISLPSQEEGTTSSQQKATENESRKQSENNEGAKNDTQKSESAGLGQETNVQSAGDDQGRLQQEEPRVLTEPEKETKNAEQVVEKPSAQPVIKKRRKFVEEPTEEKPLSKTEKKSEDIARGINPKSEVASVKMQRSPGERIKYGDGDVKDFYVTEDIARKAYDAYVKEEGAGVQPYETILRRGGFGVEELNVLHPTWKEELYQAQAKPLEEPNVQGSVATKSPEEIQPITKKEITDASTQSNEQQQEGNPEGGEQEHARTEQAGREIQTAEATNSNSLQRSQGEKEEEIKSEGHVTVKSDGDFNEHPDRSGGEESKPEAESQVGGKVESFETSQGSKYEVLADGRTKRFKTATGEEQEPQDLTVFAKFKDAEQEQRFLEGIQQREESGTKVYVIDKDGKIYDKNEEAQGKDVRLALVNSKTGEVLETADTKTEPTKGYNTFDQRRFTKDGEELRESHIGNKVTKINYSEGEPGKKPLSPEEKIKAERAVHQKLVEQGKAAEKERQKALKSKDAEAIQVATDKVNELKDKALAKETKIEKLVNAQINEGVFGRAADWIEKTYAKNKKEHEGSAYASIFGLSPKIADDAMDFMVAKIVEGLHALNNREMAIRRAYRLMKEKYGYDEKDLDESEDLKKLRDSEHIATPKLKAEPILSIDNEEAAKDILADIFAGKITREEAVKEVIDEIIENREGNPVSDAVAENAKAKILNYLDWHIQQDLTSIKNATTRLRREQFGLNEEIPTARKEFGETWEEAQAKIEKGYDPQSLIEELSQHPRPVTDVENAILLHQQNTKEIELIGLNDNINKAATESDQALLIEHKVAKARVLDELQKIYDVNKAVGTENARGLASRAMMVDRKYSLVNMLSEKRATANDGQPLSEEQQEQIEDLHKKIKETQDAFDKYVSDAQSQIIEMQRKALDVKLKDKTTASQKLRNWAERIRNASKNQAYSSPIPITPHMVADAIDLIADGVEKGEQLVALIKKAIDAAGKANPGIDQKELEKEINRSLIDSGILESSPEKKKAHEMNGLFINGRLDREAVRLKTIADRAKAQYDINLKKDEEKQLSKTGKAQNLFIKWQRAFKLSNPLTMGKLMMAAVTRLTTTPLEDLVGGAYSTIFPRLGKGAIGEGGGLNVRETASAYKRGLLIGMRDASEVLSKRSQGKSELDVLFGKAGELPPEAIDFLGQLHSATKAPVKRVLFERSLEKRLRRNLANGVDITDPMVQTSIMTDAYKDANRAIFMQDNTVAEGWRKLIKHFQQIDPRTGKAPNKALAVGLQWMVPFVKVPTNIAAEVGTNVYGIPVGAAKMLHAAFTKGIESLSADEKDIILRNLKKGTLGAAALALGYFNAQNFGGYYQPGKKRNEDDAEAMGLKLFGEKVPAWFVESPIFQAMQVGATIRRVKEAKVHGEENGIGEGIWAGATGITQAVPMVSLPIQMSQLFNPKERQYYLGELAKSTVDPSLVTYLAKVTDPADKGNPLRKAIAPENKRKTPKTIAEHIKSGLPYFREELEPKEETW